MSSDPACVSLPDGSAIDDDSTSAEIAAKAEAQLVLVTFVSSQHP